MTKSIPTLVRTQLLDFQIYWMVQTLRQSHAVQMMSGQSGQVNSWES